jgi:hypothetical protein
MASAIRRLKSLIPVAVLRACDTESDPITFEIPIDLTEEDR